MPLFHGFWLPKKTIFPYFIVNVSSINNIAVSFSFHCLSSLLFFIINQSINISINISINQSINISINQYINQPINQSINQSKSLKYVFWNQIPIESLSTATSPKISFNVPSVELMKCWDLLYVCVSGFKIKSNSWLVASGATCLE